MKSEVAVGQIAMLIERWCRAVRADLEARGLRTVVAALDDFYLPSAERRVLAQIAQTVHPLLRMRGVPGTHDVELALQILRQLGKPAARGSDRSPRMGSSDDPCRAGRGPLNLAAEFTLSLLG